MWVEQRRALIKEIYFLFFSDFFDLFFLELLFGSFACTNESEMEQT